MSLLFTKESYLPSTDLCRSLWYSYPQSLICAHHWDISHGQSSQVTEPWCCSWASFLSSSHLVECLYFIHLFDLCFLSKIINLMAALKLPCEMLISCHFFHGCNPKQLACVTFSFSWIPHFTYYVLSLLTFDQTVLKKSGLSQWPRPQ